MNRQIVIIEDDRDILDMIQLILADEGYDVIGFAGLQGVEKIIEHQPSVILLDNRLGDGYGNTFCATLKSNPGTKHIPVILVSASGDLASIAKKCNADGYLPKPFDLDDLIKIVKQFSSASETYYDVTPD